ncbi:MAG: carbohydrate kinase family protein [bacterium]
MNILVSGSVAYDVIMDFPGSFKDHILPDKIHMLNVSFLVDGLRRNFGGTAGNIAYNLSLLGEKSTILASVGRDFDRYKEWLHQNNIDTSHINVLPDEDTAVAHMITDQSNNQIIAFYAGAMQYACGPIQGKFVTDDVFGIVAPGYKDEMVAYPTYYRKNGISFIFDPGQQTSTLSSDELRQGMKGAKIVIVNDYEWALLLQKTGMTEEDVLVVVDMVIVTLGEKGSRVITQAERLDIPAVQNLSVKDPTGAGDAYRAGLIKGLNMQWSIDIVCRFASVVAAYVVEEHGTQVHAFTFDDVLKRYKEAYGNEIK